MSLEKRIIEWSASRPPWQRAILRRVALGNVLSEEDYDQLVDALLLSKGIWDSNFDLKSLPEVKFGDPPVNIVSISDIHHINALSSKEALTFETTGLTIVYGDNATGKSGYSRILKRIARSRHKEDVLSDVFNDTERAKPTAAISVKVGGEEMPIAWPESSRPELQRMLFYDDACGNAYISTEYDFPYRPSALFVMDGLIKACIEIRKRVEAKLEENAASTKALPVVTEEVKGSEIGRFLEKLSGSSSLQALDSLTEKLFSSSETIDNLRSEEARLLASDTTKERQRLARLASKFNFLRTHVEGISQVLGNMAIASFQDERARLKSLEEAAALLAKSFESEPLPGVGTSLWKELWESARRYSTTHAYSGHPFPVVEEDSKCVLCHQALGNMARERLRRFESFVKDDTLLHLHEAQTNWNSRTEKINQLPPAEPVV